MSIMRYEPTVQSRIERWSFHKIDGEPYINENGVVVDHKNAERDEQFIGWEFILPSDSVLELGGRYGTVSCLVNNKLDDPFKHVVIEPDDRVIPALLVNRATHNSFFTVYQNIISNEPKVIIHADYATRMVCCNQRQEAGVPLMTLNDLYRHHGFPFTALIADCEGCLEGFIKENKYFVAQLRMITYEKDFGEICDYVWIANELQSMGFKNVKNGFHTVWEKTPQIAQHASGWQNVMTKYCRRSF